MFYVIQESVQKIEKREKSVDMKPKLQRGAAMQKIVKI